MVKEILPRQLSQYFLLDGEFMEYFWKSNRNIREGIEQISQLHLISGASEHIQRHMMIPSKGYSKDTNDLTDKKLHYNNALGNIKSAEKLAIRPNKREEYRKTYLGILQNENNY